MQMRWPERQLVAATVALGNAKTLRESTKAWAQLVQVVSATRDVPSLVYAPSGGKVLRQAEKVGEWLRGVSGRSAGELAEVLDEYIRKIELRPVLAIHRGRTVLEPTMLGAHPYQLAALGVALLLDKDKPWRARFGLCTVCDQYFFDERKGRGPKRWLVCSQKCRDHKKYQRRKARLALAA